MTSNKKLFNTKELELIKVYLFVFGKSFSKLQSYVLKILGVTWSNLVKRGTK